MKWSLNKSTRSYELHGIVPSPNQLDVSSYIILAFFQTNQSFLKKFLLRRPQNNSIVLNSDQSSMKRKLKKSKV